MRKNGSHETQKKDEAKKASEKDRKPSRMEDRENKMRHENEKHKK